MIKMQALEELKAIVKKAPDRATHVQVVESENQYFESNGFGFWCLNSDCQVVAEDIVSVRSLSDIKHRIELMEAVQGLLQVFGGVQDGYWRNELNAARKALGYKS